MMMKLIFIRAAGTFTPGLMPWRSKLGMQLDRFLELFKLLQVLHHQVIVTLYADQ